MEVAFISALLFTMVSAAVDGTLVNNKHYIDDHTPRWIFRFSIFVLIGLFFQNVCLFLASAFLFTALFDQMMNFVRGIDFWYLGTVAKWDVFFSKYKWLYISTKILTLLLALFLFYYAEALQFNFLQQP